MLSMGNIEVDDNLSGLILTCPVYKGRAFVSRAMIQDMRQAGRPLLEAFFAREGWTQDFNTDYWHSPRDVEGTVLQAKDDLTYPTIIIEVAA